MENDDTLQREIHLSSSQQSQLATLIKDAIVLRMASAVGLGELAIYLATAKRVILQMKEDDNG